MPLVINALGGRHTHTYRHANQSNFKKPGARSRRFKNDGRSGSKVFFKQWRKYSHELHSTLVKSLEYFHPHRSKEYMNPTCLIKLISNTMLKWHWAHYFEYSYNIVIFWIFQFSSAFQQFPNDG